MGEKEVWKDVVGFEGRYQVSNRGRVKDTWRSRLLRQSKRPQGFTVHLNTGSRDYTRRVDTLVKDAFSPEPQPTEEEWRDVFGSGVYQVSNLGRVRNRKSMRILRLQTNKDGYHVVRLFCVGNQTHRVHRLVASAFIPNPLNLQQVNHLLPPKNNNHVSNLEWASPSQNVRHSFKTGLHMETLTPVAVTEIKALKGILPLKEIAKLYKVSKATVSRIHLGRAWKTTIPNTASPS